VRIGPYTVDFLWRETNLIVEVDGYRAHAGRQAFTDDRVRDARLAVLGFDVRRIADWQLTNEPRTVAETVLAVLSR
jgi:very-short-patch-repair endonuclease